VTNHLFKLAIYDVQHLLPTGWAQQMAACARAGGLVDEPGMDLGLNVGDGRPLRYSVTKGDRVALDLPWLDDLYRSQFRELAGVVYGSEMDAARELHLGVNLNYLRPGDSYEWHPDTNPLTGLLFGSTLDEADGGELVFDAADLGFSARVRPIAGRLLLFDARLTPHAIEPLSNGVERVSAAMNYYVSGGEQGRPEGEDARIYGERR